MPAEPIYQPRLKVLRAIFMESAMRRGADCASGRVNPPWTEAELAQQDEHTQRYLHCSLPVCYANLLREFGGMEAKGTWLCGADEPNGQDAGRWPRKGIIHATLSWVVLQD